MIKTILLAAIIIFFAWLSMDYFSITLPTSEPSKQKEKPSKKEPFNVFIPQKNIINTDMKKDE